MISNLCSQGLRAFISDTDKLEVRFGMLYASVCQAAAANGIESAGRPSGEAQGEIVTGRPGCLKLPSLGMARHVFFKHLDLVKMRRKEQICIARKSSKVSKGLHVPSCIE